MRFIKITILMWRIVMTYNMIPYMVNVISIGIELYIF